MKNHQADVIIVGAGLAGLVAAAEVADAGKSVLLLDQEGEQNLGRIISCKFARAASFRNP
jgi:uncharacterized protein